MMNKKALLSEEAGLSVWVIHGHASWGGIKIEIKICTHHSFHSNRFKIKKAFRFAEGLLKLFV